MTAPQPISVPSTSVSGGQLNPAQIAGVAAAAGWTGKDLIIAVAVALAESSGNINATHINADGSVDRGLWQLNNRTVPDVGGVNGIIFDPKVNASFAYKLWETRGWQPWSTYNNGDYKQHLQAATDAVQHPEQPIVSIGDKIANSATSTFDAMASLAKAVVSIAQGFVKGIAWISNSDNWVRVAQVVLGGALLVMALNVVARPLVNQAAAPIVNVVKKVA